MSEASAAYTAKFEQVHGVRLPPCEVSVQFLCAVADRRHLTVVPPEDSRRRGYAWYCACGAKGATKASRHTAVAGGAEHERTRRA